VSGELDEMLGGDFTQGQNAQMSLEMMVIAYNDGSLDSGFGSGGMASLPSAAGLVSTIGIASDGKPVIAGPSGFGCTITRPGTNGTLDADFAEPFEYADVLVGKADSSLSTAPINVRLCAKNSGSSLKP
jgi:hypothetical protein